MCCILTFFTFGRSQIASHGLQLAEKCSLRYFYFQIEFLQALSMVRWLLFLTKGMQIKVESKTK
jgi:hypothetical protein